MITRYATRAAPNRQSGKTYQQEDSLACHQGLEVMHLYLRGLRPGSSAVDACTAHRLAMPGRITTVAHDMANLRFPDRNSFFAASLKVEVDPKEWTLDEAKRHMAHWQATGQQAKVDLGPEYRQTGEPSRGF